MPLHPWITKLFDIISQTIFLCSYVRQNMSKNFEKFHKKRAILL